MTADECEGFYKAHQEYHQLATPIVWVFAHENMRDTARETGQWNRQSGYMMAAVTYNEWRYRQCARVVDRL